MREFEIPKAVTVRLTNPQTGERLPPIEYDFHRFHREQVWGQPEWRQKNNIEARERCIEAIDEKPVGHKVKLTEEDFEIYKPIATMEGKPLGPDIAIEVPRLMEPILLAKSSKDDNGKSEHVGDEAEADG